jgi:hypothetical protein
VRAAARRLWRRGDGSDAYNLAFVAPLVVIFLLAWAGMRSESLIAWQRKHTALVRFATCGLFLVLWAVLVIS